MAKKAAGTMPVKVSVEMHREAKKLLEVVSLHGWSAVGISRKDPPTLMALLEEGIRALAKRTKEGGAS